MLGTSLDSSHMLCHPIVTADPQGRPYFDPHLHKRKLKHKEFSVLTHAHIISRDVHTKTMYTSLAYFIVSIEIIINII